MIGQSPDQQVADERQEAHCNDDMPQQVVQMRRQTVQRKQQIIQKKVKDPERGQLHNCAPQKTS